MNLLAPGLLEGRAIAVAGGLPEAVARALGELGARLEPVGDLAAEDEATGEWARAHGPLDGLVYDGGAPFGAGGPEALTAMMEEAWAVVREVAVGALIEDGRPGKIVLLGPRPAVGPGSGAARAALENLARTLSVEWARHNVTTVMVAPGANTRESELADLICFLCSRAGDYFSGCRIELAD